MSETTDGRVLLRTLRRILALSVGVEAVGTAVYGVYLGVETVVAPAVDRAGGAALAVVAVGIAVVLGLAVRSVLGARAGVRVPLVVWQVMLLAVASLTVGSPWVVLGAVLAVVAVLIVVTAMWPGVLGSADRSGSTGRAQPPA